jgi:hypothetical protein
MSSVESVGSNASSSVNLAAASGESATIAGEETALANVSATQASTVSESSGTTSLTSSGMSGAIGAGSAILAAQTQAVEQVPDSTVAPDAVTGQAASQASVAATAQQQRVAANNMLNITSKGKV